MSVLIGSDGSKADFRDIRFLRVEVRFTAMTFALGAGYTYARENPLEDGRTNVQVNINLSSAMTPDEYQRVVDAATGG